MSLLVRKLVSQLVRKAASDPAVRAKAMEVARGVVSEGEKIAKEEDRAYAAGKALRRALKGSQPRR